LKEYFAAWRELFDHFIKQVNTKRMHCFNPMHIGHCLLKLKIGNDVSGDFYMENANTCYSLRHEKLRGHDENLILASFYE
jgi:hypothetical protein